MSGVRLPIANPCPEVSKLRGEGTELHCARCDASVHDLSAMTQEQAVSFLDTFVGRTKPCVRYKVSSRGDIVFAASRRASAPGWGAVAAAGVLAALHPTEAAADRPEPASAAVSRDYDGPQAVRAPEAAQTEAFEPCPIAEPRMLGGVPPTDDRFFSRDAGKRRRLERRQRRTERRAKRRDRASE